MTDNPIHKTALAGVDAKAQVDDLLDAKRALDEDGENIEWEKFKTEIGDERTYFVTEPVKPTDEERVWRGIALLREGAKNLREEAGSENHPDALTLDRAANDLESLLADNKALREKHQAALKSLELWAEVEGRHNPDTHVAVPREFVDGARKKLEIYERVIGELDEGNPWEAIDNGLINGGEKYSREQWAAYMRESLINATRSIVLTAAEKGD